MLPMGRVHEKGYLYFELLVGIGLWLILLSGAMLHLSETSSQKWEVKAAITMLERDLGAIQQQLIYGKSGVNGANLQMYIFKSSYFVYSGDRLVWKRDFPSHVFNESGTYKIVFQRDGRSFQDSTILLASSDKKTIGVIYIAAQTGRIRTEIKERIGS